MIIITTKVVIMYIYMGPFNYHFVWFSTAL